MINFILTRRHQYTFDKARKADGMPPFCLIDYDRLIDGGWVRRGAYIFSDFDRLSLWDLEVVSRVYRKMEAIPGFRVMNNPARIPMRYDLLRLLYERGLNGFDVHRAVECGSTMRYPVFLRRERSHGSILSGLLHSVEDAELAVEEALKKGYPLDNLMFVEYMAEPVQPDIFRKWSAFRIGERIFQQTCTHDRQWLVKYGQKGVTGEELYLEELEMLKAGRSPHEEHLKNVFELAQVEYGRVDYGVVGGKVQVYEINTNPGVNPPHNHRSQARVESLCLAWQLYTDALGLVDAGRGAWAHVAWSSKAYPESCLRKFCRQFFHSRQAP